MRPLLLLALLTAHLATAADDAPLRCFTPLEIQRVADGKAASDRLAANDAARIAALEETVTKQHEGTVAVPLVVLTAVLAVGAGFALGFGAAKATAPKP